MYRTMKRASLGATLYRLIYCSRNVIPGIDLEREIHDILDVARRSNSVAKITGAMLLTVSGFAQVLEGPRDAVERTLERISDDVRHTGLMVLSFAPTQRRCFPEWAMGFHGQASMLADPLAHLLANPRLAGPRATTGSDVLRLLESVVRQEGEWVAA